MEDLKKLQNVAEAAREYRQKIKEISPAVNLYVGNPEVLEPIKEAAHHLDDALEKLAG